jgi:hypothetical protein
MSACPGCGGLVGLHLALDLRIGDAAPVSIDPAPRPLQRQDAAVVVRITAVLESYLLSGEADPDLVEALIRHLHAERLVGADAGPADLRLALANLNHRVRHANGEYDTPPQPDTGQVDHLFGFLDRAAAEAFAEAAAARGEAVAAPVAVDGRAYDGEVGWQVAVRTTELPLSVAFDRHVLRLAALAGEHSGSYGGWSTVPIS